MPESFPVNGPRVAEIRDRVYPRLSQGRLGASLKPRRTTGWVHKLEHDDLKTVWKDIAEQVAVLLGVPLEDLAKEPGEPINWLDEDAETVHENAGPGETSSYTLPESLGLRRVARYRGHAGPGGTRLGDDLWDAESFADGEHVSVVVEGGCMEPELHDGDVVLVAKEIAPEPGDIVVFTEDDRLFFAFYRQHGTDVVLANSNGERGLHGVMLEGVVMERKTSYRARRRRGNGGRRA